MKKTTVDETLYMPKERYVAAMMRIRSRILLGLAMTAEDDTTIGSKSTACSWGLCSDDQASWPDAEDHLWPDQFAKHKRVAPKYLQEGQLCPLDRREPAEASLQGCFFTCRVFKPKKGDAPLTRENVIKFYHHRIDSVS